ncbi:hypothetical protein GLYMA_02G135000v4 [Glycine max]|uniref:Uncharacterized protein n=1 Tax=Glycine max TaxID=3847 RepID=K7K849_SOYBN|nr:hypothetical protein JHK86_004034 [Glycine max]KAH1060163.1 hypothetical protein GYH30_003922 [Glycine max]KRH71181.1 hypothetical protein GLYMA_02G135000v4 [Glycine max]
MTWVAKCVTVTSLLQPSKPMAESAVVTLPKLLSTLSPTAQPLARPHHQVLHRRRGLGHLRPHLGGREPGVPWAPPPPHPTKLSLNAELHLVSLAASVALYCHCCEFLQELCAATDVQHRGVHLA